MPDVRLVDLEVIRRYSLAVRQESVEASELIGVLEADLARLQKATKPARTRSARASKPAARRTKSAATTARKSR